MLSQFNEERKKEIDEQRKGLSLAPLFKKPRPMWADPVFVATLGDAFVECTAMEGNSSLARSFVVLNHILVRAMTGPLISRPVENLQPGGDTVGAVVSADSGALPKGDGNGLGSGLGQGARGILSDCVHVLRQSEFVFKLMLKVKNESTLMAFLKKLKVVQTAS